MKLCVFDFDSTLMDGETIDFFAEALGIKEQVGAITERAMQGELDFFGSLTERVKLLQGLEYSKVEEIAHALPYMKGAQETITEFKKAGYRVVCFSGGFRVATSYAKSILGYDADFSNVLHQEEGRLSGLVGGDMMFDFSKGDMLLRLQELLGVSKNDTVVVGDGANDRSMFMHADTRIAFCAKEILRKEANITVDTKDLTKMFDYLKL